MLVDALQTKALCLYGCELNDDIIKADMVIADIKTADHRGSIVSLCQPMNREAEFIKAEVPKTLEEGINIGITFQVLS